MRAGTDTSAFAAGGAEARIESLLDRCERTERRAHRISILQEVARLYEHELADASTAYVVLLAALDEDYTFAPVASSLARLASELELWGELIADRLAKVDALEEEAPDRAADLWVLIASWYEHALDERAYAIAALRSALRLAPSHGAALAALAELLREREAWLELADVTERRATAESDPTASAALWLELGALARDRLDDPELAIAAYRSLLRAEPDCRPALDALQQLYRDGAAWDALLDVLGTKADATPDEDERTALLLESALLLEHTLRDSERAELMYQAVALDRAVAVLEAQLQRAPSPAHADLHWQLGRVQLRRGQDAAAERCFAQALVARDDYVPALLALAELYERRGDWLKAATTLGRAEGHVADPSRRLALRLRAAHIYDRELGHAAHASAGYEAVLELAPRHAEAARALVELRFRAGQWEELSPLLDSLLAHPEIRRGPASERAQLWYRAGRCAEALGGGEPALRCYDNALAADPSLVDALRARAALAFATGAWPAAIESYEQLKANHAHELADGARAELCERLGHAYRQRGEPDTALDRYEQALLFDARSRPALEAIAELQAAAGQWLAAVRAQRTLLGVASLDERFELFCAIAATLRERLADPHGAIAALREAAALRPADHGVRQRLLDLYTLTRQWRDAVAIIEQFAEHEADPVRKGKYYQAAATICRDELAADDDAIAFFDLALDHYFRDPEIARGKELPTFLKAFAAIDAILTGRRDWKLQERAYRQMIKRLAPGHPVLGELWHGLGEIYRTRLEQYETAIAAFEVAAGLAPCNVQRQQILAELYAIAGRDRADHAIAAHRAVLARDPWRYESYHALAQLFEGTGRPDAAWCVCAALVFLQRATPHQQALYERHRRHHPIAVKLGFTDATWRHVIPAGEHRYLGALLAAVSQPAARLRVRSPRALGIDAATRVGLDEGAPPIARGLDYARRVLGVPAPELYAAPGLTGELTLPGYVGRDAAAPAVVIQGRALACRDDHEVAFVAGRYAAYLRRDHFARVALPDDAELQGAIAGALRLGGADTPVDGVAAAFAAALVPAARAALQPHQLDQHRLLVERFLARGAPLDARTWREAVDLTAHRVGLVLCGSLDVATRQLARDHGPAGVSDSAADIRRLVLYSISDDHFAVRAQLGTDIGAQ